jgi:uncharacterized phage protein (TIGR01671 family)
MREIKFRAFVYQEKRMLNVDEINFLKRIVFLSDPNNLYRTMRLFNEIELIGYTGYEDKNGTEIYAGDIVRYEYPEDSCWGKAGVYTGHIRFDKGGFEIVHHGDRIIRYPDGSWYEPSKCDDIKSFMSWAHRVEIIGNIYENPELLEGEE